MIGCLLVSLQQTNDIGKEGGIAIGEALKTNAVLTQLDLSCQLLICVCI